MLHYSKGSRDMSHDASPIAKLIEDFEAAMSVREEADYGMAFIVTEGPMS